MQVKDKRVTFKIRVENLGFSLSFLKIRKIIKNGHQLYVF